MPRRAASITQADVARAIRAAKQTGAGPVRIMPDGTILIDMQPAGRSNSQQNEVARDEEVVL